MPIKTFLVLIVAIAGNLAIAGEPCPEGLTEIPLTQEHWKTYWVGHGAVNYEAGGSLYMNPGRTVEWGETHSALVVSKKSFKYFSAQITYENIKATRVGGPKEWEVFWAFFNFKIDPKTGKKDTNYFISKPIGSELGTAKKEIDQPFMHTGSWPRVGYKEKVVLQMEHTPEGFQASMKNRHSLTSSFSYWPWFTNHLATHEGNIGLYTEDAEVRVMQVCIGPISTPKVSSVEKK